MTKLNIKIIKDSSSSSKISHLGISHYLRLGFLPAPFSILNNEYAVTTYEDIKFRDDILNLKTREFTRNLRQFSGERNKKAFSSLSSFDSVKLLEDLILNKVKEATFGYDNIFLMISGGKDSLSLAWALYSLNKKVTLIHCINQDRENEKPDVESIAKKYGFDCYFILDDIEVATKYLEENIDKLPIPIGDPAFFGYINAVKKISTYSILNKNKKVLLLDGMGNDAYMGHIPPTREKYLINLPRISLINEQFASFFYKFQIPHYLIETLFKRREERIFSGIYYATEANPISGLRNIFTEYYHKPEERRALIRGGIFDLDQGIRKGILAACLGCNIDIKFPFLDKNLIDFFQTQPEKSKFDYSKSTNKKLLRKLLNRNGVRSEFVNLKKGSFRFNLKSLSKIYTPSYEIVELLNYLGIKKSHINRTLKASLNRNFASQKLGILYVLDKYLKSKSNLITKTEYNYIKSIYLT